MKIELYHTVTGNCPIADFLNRLPKKLQAAAYGDIDVLKEKGNDMGMPFSKTLGNGLYELRVREHEGSIRIFYFFFDGEKIILTNGFLKKTQATPRRELDKARNYKKDYEGRYKHGL